MLFGCPGGYGGNFQNVTNYRLPKQSKTPGGVRHSVPNQYQTSEFRSLLDRKTDELEKCLGIEIRRGWFVVMVPVDWYVSECSGEWLVPSTVPCRLCRDKGLNIPDECCGLRKPTESCPCVCNARAAIQDNYIIITAPNLKLYKAELARLVTGINNVWSDPKIRPCL